MTSRALVLAALAVSLLALAAPAAADGDIDFSFTTTFRAYDYVDEAGDAVRFRSLSPSLLVSGQDVLAHGVGFEAKVRRLDDLEDDRKGEHELLFGAVTWRSPRGRAECAFGRQLLEQGIGYLIVDGVRATVRPGSFELGVASGFGFEHGGRMHEGAPFASLLARWQAGHRAFVSGSVEYGRDDHTEVLFKDGLSGGLRLGRGDLRAVLVYDHAVGELDEASGELKLALGPDTLHLEASRIHPHFDPTTIWNVFNSGPYDRYSVRIRHPLGTVLDLWARYERRAYFHLDKPGAPEPAQRPSTDMFNLGFGSPRRAPLAWQAELFFNGGFGGLRTGASVRIGRELGFFPGRLDGGIDLRAYNRGIRDPRQDLTTAYWAELQARLGKHARLRVRAEDYRNGYVLDDFGVTVKLDFASSEGL